MPYQNRVTPFGELIAHPARGALMGNRGRLLTPAGLLRRRPWAVTRWIACRLSFKDRRVAIWSPRHYTPLFFLDEATAFAAGHRPCAECRRADFNRFMAAWRCAHRLDAGVPLRVAAIDRQLHAERVDSRGAQITYQAALAELPPGVFVLRAGDQAAYLVTHDALLAWSPAGYTHAVARPRTEAVRVLTPRSLVAVCAHGYTPQWAAIDLL